ncbi:MAG TPA: NAD(P)/FAD-dependent oxidoreductase, partial [Xanthobacteraceae bacterium]|nr:NAD(P)/FAD-dependent oxidoreductase [Xanthobacteraceae bacterium]
ISVDGQTLSAGHVLIAAGAHPAPVRFPGAEHLITSEQFMTLGHLPPRIAMVGGGYIAAEFSHIAARAGAKVTVLQRGPRILPNFDPDLVSWLMEKFDELGIDVRTDHSVEAIERSGNAYRVHTTGENGNSAIDTDLVIHAAGRVPEIENLDLTAGDVALENGKIQLNEFLQSVSNPIVYAAGDAASKGPPLTPVATQDGKVVAANLLDGNCKRPDYRGVPSVAFSLPPIAAVGLSEAVVRKHDAQVRIKCAKVPDWNTAKRVGESVYGYKTIVDARNDRILGAHLVGPQADEVINLFGLAIRYGLTASDLKEAIFAYPTGASDLSHML